MGQHAIAPWLRETAVVSGGPSTRETSLWFGCSCRTSEEGSVEVAALARRRPCGDWQQRLLGGPWRGTLECSGQ